ncbi:hypothetical protein Hdeb2414_s0002g00076091 [Helianthus debilis subsp. tardiflorus]
MYLSTCAKLQSLRDSRLKTRSMAYTTGTVRFGSLSVHCMKVKIGTNLIQKTLKVGTGLSLKLFYFGKFGAATRYNLLLPDHGCHTNNDTMRGFLKDHLVKSRPFGLVEDKKWIVTTKLECGAVVGIFGQKAS